MITPILQQFFGGLAKVDEVISPTFNEFLDRIPVVLTGKGCIVAMFAMVYLTHFLRAFMQIGLTGKINVVNPRDALKKPTTTWQEKMVNRAYAAHFNTIEAFTFFSAAVLLYLQAHGVDENLEKLANAFVLIRVAYVPAYIYGLNPILANIRAVLFGAGLLIISKIMAAGAGEIVKSI